MSTAGTEKGKEPLLDRGDQVRKHYLVTKPESVYIQYTMYSTKRRGTIQDDLFTQESPGKV